MRLTAVIPVYNEANNIASMLDSLLTQRLSTSTLVEAIVVSSGSTDATPEIVRAKSAADPRVRLLTQDVRLGKAAALNAYLRERDPTCDLILISSGDVLLQPGFLDLLVRAFDDPKVGMCGGRPVPTNPRDSLVGRMVHFMWDLHHEIGLDEPKLGEAVAVRASLIAELPQESPVDEASIEAQIASHGYRLHYVPEAVLANRGPSNLRDFVKQRRRIAAGHYWLRETTGYEVSTLDVGRVVRRALKYPTFTNPVTDFAYVAAAGLEGVSRLLGYFDLKRGHSHAIWSIAESAHDTVAGDDQAADQPKTANG